jgi:hypothetical protein
MKFFLFFSFFFMLASCQVSQVAQDDFYKLPMPPLRPPEILPPSPPPSFTPDIREIQVNRLPHPFNVNGTVPYQVWVDGERLPLNSNEAIAITKSLNLKFTQPPNTAEIHSGEGWIHPLRINTVIK